MCVSNCNMGTNICNILFDIITSLCRSKITYYSLFPSYVTLPAPEQTTPPTPPPSYQIVSLQIQPILFFSCPLSTNDIVANTNPAAFLLPIVINPNNVVFPIFSVNKSGTYVFKATGQICVYNGNFYADNSELTEAGPFNKNVLNLAYQLQYLINDNDFTSPNVRNLGVVTQSSINKTGDYTIIINFSFEKEILLVKNNTVLLNGLVTANLATIQYYPPVFSLTGFVLSIEKKC